MLQPVLVIVAINLKTEEPLLIVDASSDVFEHCICDFCRRTSIPDTNKNMVQLLLVQTVLLQHGKECLLVILGIANGVL